MMPAALLKAFSSEVGTGSREENASEQKAAKLIAIVLHMARGIG